MEFKLQDYEYIWRNNGIVPGESSGKLMSFTDALAVSNAPTLLPKVISNIVKEAAEPYLVGASLLQRINYQFGQVITFPAVGALTAADIPEGGEYPERTLPIGGATVRAEIGKSGLAVRITEEMIRYSQYDVIGMHLRAAGRALARHKEYKIFKHIQSVGVKCFDNVTPATSIFGVTTGRDLAGAGNGSITMDDLFDAMGQVITQGFMPDTLLMHPLTWVMFVKDPTLRAFALAAGGGSFFAGWNGRANQLTNLGDPDGRGNPNGQNIIPGGNAAGLTPSANTDYPNQLQASPKIPGYFPFPMRIVVSPFVYYDATRKLTDIYIFDSNELGALVVDEDITLDEFEDPTVDIRKLKIKERYAIAILNAGQGIGTIRNVHVVPNQIVLPAQATQDVSGTIAAISPTENVLD